MSPEEIRARRQALGWTQARLAAAAGTRQQTIDRLERGAVRRPRALPAVIAALSAIAPAGSGSAASVSASVDSVEAPRARGLCAVYGAIPGRDMLRLTAAVEMLPPPPMLADCDAYGLLLEHDLAPFWRGDVLWFNPNCGRATAVRACFSTGPPQGRVNAQKRGWCSPPRQTQTSSPQHTA